MKPYDDPRLYAIVKKITLDAGFPYTDPRTLKTTQPKMNKKKKPVWVLFEQLHVDVEISIRMSPGNRAELRKALNSATLIKRIINTVITSGPMPPQGVNPQIRVKINK
jgi:hypothetical protein